MELLSFLIGCSFKEIKYFENIEMILYIISGAGVYFSLIFALIAFYFNNKEEKMGEVIDFDKSYTIFSNSYNYSIWYLVFSMHTIYLSSYFRTKNIYEKKMEHYVKELKKD